MTSGMTKLLAIDPAATSGFAVFNAEGHLEASGKFQVEGQGFYRFKSMKEHIEALVSLYKPSHCIIEDIQQQRNVATFKVLAGYQSIICSVLLEHEVEVETVYVSSWRSTVQLRARGRENQKQAAQNMVEELYGVRTNQDTAESILIGRSYFEKRKNELNWS